MIGKLISALFSFKGLYVAFVIAIVFYGQVRMMFGLTPRHIAIAVMWIACIRSGLPFPMGRVMKTYLLFVLSFIVSATLTGHLSQLLITYYIAACIGYWATKILVTKYKDGKLLLKTIIVLGFVNAIVTIGQTLNMPLADRVVSLLHLELPEKYLAKLAAEEGEKSLLFTRPGLFNSAVYNGYFHMTAGVTALLLLARRINLVNVAPWLIISIGTICVQERSPIAILIVLSLFGFYKLFTTQKHRKLKMFAVAAFLSITYGVQWMYTSALEEDRLEELDAGARTSLDVSDEVDDLYSVATKGRFAQIGFEDTGRGDIYEQTIDYLMDHPYIGGYHRFARMYRTAPHNLFLNAFIYGGFVGGFAILLILLWQVKPLWRVLRRKIAHTNPVCFFAGLAYLSFTLNSLVHNRSIVTGDEFLWMLWAVFYYEYRKYFTTPRL